jgi:hypothetical protein
MVSPPERQGDDKGCADRWPEQEPRQAVADFRNGRHHCGRRSQAAIEAVGLVRSVCPRRRGIGLPPVWRERRRQRSRGSCGGVPRVEEQARCLFEWSRPKDGLSSREPAACVCARSAALAMSSYGAGGDPQLQNRLLFISPPPFKDGRLWLRVLPKTGSTAFDRYGRSMPEGLVVSRHAALIGPAGHLVPNEIHCLVRIDCGLTPFGWLSNLNGMQHLRAS